MRSLGRSECPTSGLMVWPSVTPRCALREASFTTCRVDFTSIVFPPWCGALLNAGIDIQIDAGDVTALLRGEEQHGVGRILRLDQAAQRIERGFLRDRRGIPYLLH